LKFYNEALLLMRAVRDTQGEAYTLDFIGGVYSALGEKEKALKFYNESLPLFSAIGDKSGEARMLACIDAVYSESDEK